MTNNLKYFRNLEFQNIIKCPFLFKKGALSEFLAHIVA